MIATKDKIKILEEVFPHGVLYENEKHRKVFCSETINNKVSCFWMYEDLKGDFKDRNDFEIAIEQMNRSNIRLFQIKITKLSKTDFIEFVKEQFYLHEHKATSFLVYWLESVKHYVITEEGFLQYYEGSIEKRGAFLKWYNDIKKTIPAEAIQEVKKLSINQIALKCFYEGKIITRENAKEQLENTGHKSGDKLYNEFSKWSNTTDRKADPESKVRLKNKIKLFESVIELLPNDKRSKAIDDLKIINSFTSKY